LTFNDLLRVFWRRKLLIIFVTIAVVVPSYVGTRLVSPEYESTATLALQPKGNNPQAAFLWSTLDSIVPVYTDAATSGKTFRRAQGILGGPLAAITVQAFKGTPTIKIKARSTNPRLAQLSAAAVTQALIDRTHLKDNPIGSPSLELIQIDTPQLPTVQVFPRVKLTIFVAALLGFGLGLGAALLRESLTTKIETAEDLARVTGAPVYAELPSESAIVKKMRSPEDLAEQPRLRIVAEAMRDLRTNLLFSDDSIRSLVVTSPDGSHGKTTVAFAFAATLARAGTRTLLVDADLRRGRIADLLELERTPGLMDVLLDQTPLKEAIRRTSDGLDVLPSGRRSADPGELLTSEFPALLSRLERQYEAVIIDSTPVIPISDARIVARHADGTLLVARAGYALRRQVRAAVERLELINVKPTAAVLNYSVAVRRSSYYVRPTSEEDETTKELKARVADREARRSRSMR
jgi:receptor protein-tyrosine kinase